MNFETADTSIMQKSEIAQGLGSTFMPASALMGDGVVNLQDEDLGDVKEIMLDMHTGKVADAVLSFGGFLGMGEKLFSVPWATLELDTEYKRFTLDVSKNRLESAPGFGNNGWPDRADLAWKNDIHSYHGTTPSAH